MGVLKPRAGVNESLDVALSPQAITWALHSGVNFMENLGKFNYSELADNGRN